MLTTDAAPPDQPGPLSRAYLDERHEPGLRLYVVPGARRLAAVRLYWNGGPATEPPDLYGVHAAAVRSVTFYEHQGRPLAEYLGMQAITITAGVTQNAAYLDLNGPAEAVPVALRRVVDVLRSGPIPPGAFVAGRLAAMHQARRRQQDIQLIAVEALRAGRAETPGPLSVQPEGTVETLTGLSHAATDDAWRRVLLTTPHAIVIGVEDGAEIGRALRPLAVEHEPPSAADTSAPLRTKPDREIWLEPRRSDQAYMMWGTLTAVPHLDDLIALEVGLHALGGWTGSLWWRRFRDERAITYGTGAAVELLVAGPSAYALGCVGMAVSPANLPAARQEVLELADRAAQQLDPAQVGACAAQLARMELLHHLSTRDLMNRTARHLMGGRSAGLAAERIQALQDFEPASALVRLGRLLEDTSLVTIVRGAHG